MDIRHTLDFPMIVNDSANGVDRRESSACDKNDNEMNHEQIRASHARLFDITSTFCPNNVVYNLFSSFTLLFSM